MPTPWNPVEGWDVPRGYWGPDQPTPYEESLMEQAEEAANMESPDMSLGSPNDIDHQEEALLKALRSYQQADEEGVMVLVSRQACEEAATAIERLRGERDALAFQLQELGQQP